MIAAVLLAGPALGQDSIVGGTQPHEVAIPLDGPEHCVDCHGGFENSPIDAWEGTMMANAMRDPLFLASLTIAEQDIPDIGSFCLRCHTPTGWLEGRCMPGDGSALIEADYEGVSCDVCHRMTEDAAGPLIGNARYTIADSPAKRGALGSPYAAHPTEADPFISSAELCGVCHEVSNPLFGDFPIERTYSEYAASAWPLEGKTCQDCHLAVVPGYAAVGPGLPERDLHVHTFAGANTWIPQVLAGEYPELGRGEAFALATARALEHLKEAATVSLVLPAQAYAGEALELQVRVDNQTGHKLPTGYPEGRRAWLEVTAVDSAGKVLLRSGTYDPVTATLPEDPWLRTYEAKLGSDGVQSYHMVQQDEIIFDGRIPPKGFRPTADIAPIGRTFETLPDGSLASWDLAPYALAVPADALGPVTVTATLWYQTTTREFVEFLRDENRTDTRGQEMYDLWERYGKDAPVQMTLATGTFPVAQPPVEVEEGGGCGCAGAPVGGAPWLVLGGVLLRRRRAISR